MILATPKSAMTMFVSEQRPNQQLASNDVKFGQLVIEFL